MVTSRASSPVRQPLHVRSSLEPRVFREYATMTEVAARSSPLVVSSRRIRRPRGRRERVAPSLSAHAKEHIEQLSHNSTHYHYGCLREDTLGTSEIAETMALEVLKSGKAYTALGWFMAFDAVIYAIPLPF